MYAIIEVGAKQYRIKKGDVIEVEKLDTAVDKELILNNVLLVSDGNKIEVGRPYLKEVKVKALVLQHIKGKKLLSFKYRRRKSSHWKKGHRQQLTRVQIKEISLD